VKVHHPTVDAIRKLLAELPNEEARAAVLEEVLQHRCRRCFDYQPNGFTWCCQDTGERDK